jgi:hypothetical protein
MPWVVIAATTEAQTENTMRMVRAFAPEGLPGPSADYGLDPGLTQYNVAAGGKLHILTGSASSAEGGEFTFAVGDEPEHWTPARNGPEFAATLADNLAKSGSRMLETCNSWEPGAGGRRGVVGQLGGAGGRPHPRRVEDPLRRPVAPPNTVLHDEPQPARPDRRPRDHVRTATAGGRTWRDQRTHLGSAVAGVGRRAAST